MTEQKDLFAANKNYLCGLQLIYLDLDDAGCDTTSYSSAHRAGNLLQMLGIFFYLFFKKSTSQINMGSFQDSYF